MRKRNLVSLFSSLNMSPKLYFHRHSSPCIQTSARSLCNATIKRRVVVTGYGAVCPLGTEVSEAWKNLLLGNSGVTRLEEEGYRKLPCQIAARISPSFKLEDHFSKADLRTMAPATALSLVAAKEALIAANWIDSGEEERERTGVAVGMGMIDLEDVCRTYDSLKVSYNRVSPYFVPRILPNMAAGQISMKFGFHGPNHAVSTACATGAHSIGDAFRFIQHGDADVMVCGGAESCISPLAIAAFCRLRALSTSFNDAPELASRPFDHERDGFVMGEGSAILILEELGHALQRNAEIHAEILGYGLSSDASHLTAPREDGKGAILSMTRALKDAEVKLTDVHYINAHATSTLIGDAVESKAIESVFGEHSAVLAVSSTKGAHGHLLGSAGNLETLFTVLTCKTGLIPPTINLNKSNIGVNLNYISNISQEWKRTDTNRRRIALKNSFGFGGTNATLCVAEYDDV